jgi:hypothetical protein
MQEELEVINDALRDVDEYQIRSGLPILSVIVVHDDGSPTSVTLESIVKYGLAYEGENMPDTLTRLAEEAHRWYKRMH